MHKTQTRCEVPENQNRQEHLCEEHAMHLQEEEEAYSRCAVPEHCYECNIPLLRARGASGGRMLYSGDAALVYRHHQSVAGAPCK